MKTIAIDGDGVLLDYNTAYSQAWFKAFGEHLILNNPRSYWPMERWNARRLVSDELEQFRSAFDLEFWSTIPAVPGALKACQRLVDQGYTLVCVTALAERFSDARAQNLRALGFPISRVITTSDEIAGGSPKAKAIADLTQLKDNIKLFSETKNIVAHAESAAELKAHLELGKKIIITTVQKFPFIVDGIDDLTERNFAVIIDEAHSSQSGSASDKLNMTLGAEDEEVPEDLQDKILAAMKGRKMSQNASYFAFTATPKPATLEKFGRQGADGKFYPFHLYSMKQAIEEKFILDVLEKYTTYKSYYEVQKSVEENPLFDTAKAQKKLKAFVEASPRTIEVKAKIMVDHFMSNVWQAKKLKGKAKAMVVTRNIECAIRYFFAIRTALQEANAPFKALVAFSGEKTVDGIKYTEDGLNSISARDLPEEFEKDDFKILVVANKYLTGFDEPMLHTMYVDKKLQGVLAVQALSRLNRCNWKLGKTDTFAYGRYRSTDHSTLLWAYETRSDPAAGRARRVKTTGRTGCRWKHSHVAALHFLGASPMVATELFWCSSSESWHKLGTDRAQTTAGQEGRRLV